MAKSIVVSDEYSWTASFGLFEWVVEFLLETIGESATRKALKEALEHNLPGVDLARLPNSGRQEVLLALRERLVDAAQFSPELCQPEPERRFTIGHIKVLKLMADEVARSVEASG